MTAHRSSDFSDEIVAATGGTLHGRRRSRSSGVTFDSREVEHGHLFVAMPGTVADGHDFVAQGLRRRRGRGAGVASRSTGRMCWSPMSPRR